MTADELKRGAEKVLLILDLVKRFVPGSVDDRIVEYIRVLSQDDPFLELLAADITAIGGLEAITITPEGAMTIRGRGGERVLGDGTLFRRFMEALPMLIELFKLFKGLG